VAQYGIDLASTAVTDISLATSLLVWDMSKVDQGNGVYLNFYADIIPVTVTPA
jgi:hypothetical protein